MKILRFLILGLLALAWMGRAQATQPAIAEAITPEIQALADGLQDDPLRIFNYVHDHIRYVFYYGSEKGAELTLLEKSGNDFDQSALLVALLRAAGYTNAGYQFGWMVLPYNSTDGSHNDIQHWLGLSQPASANPWSTTLSYFSGLCGNFRFFPTISYASGWPSNYFGFQRVWVTLPMGSITNYLDPGFKVSEPLPGINLTNAMGFSSNNLMSVAQGTDTASYVSSLNEVNINGTLAGYTTNLLNYLQSSYPNASVQQILGGQYIVPSTNTLLSQCYLFSSTNLAGIMPVTNWVNEPTNMMSTLTISYSSVTQTWLMPQLQGQRLSLVVSNNSAQLWLADSNAASGSVSGTFDMLVTVLHPGKGGGWNYTNNTLTSGNSPLQYWRANQLNSTYGILYGFDPDWGWLQQRQNQLDAYLNQGYAINSRQVVSETLNVMGLNWMLQTEYLHRMLADQMGVLPEFANRVGRMAQEAGAGYYVDVFLQFDGAYPANPSSAQIASPFASFDNLSAYFDSAFEHGIIEQLQSSNLIAASTVKILELANTNKQAIYLATTSNWTTVESKLVHYTDNDLLSLINANGTGNFVLLLPENGNIGSSYASSWIGYGFVDTGVTPDYVGYTSMFIGQGMFGGYAFDLSATVNPPFVDQSAYSQPLYFSATPPSLPSLTGADPVEMADGTFQVQSSDLSLGGTEPRGLSLSRYYSSSRRNSNLAGLAPGWLHNYYLKATTLSAPQASLGGTTPAQAAALLVATATAANIYNFNGLDPKNWLTTALIAKWGIDQITAKAVSVTLGESTYQFIQQPNGNYTPPANCTMTLLKTNGVYWLQERHGRTFQFNSAGWATNIVDPYNQSLSLTYNASNFVQKVKDWKNRTLTFNYNNGTSNRLLSVTDNSTPARSVYYAYSASNDLAAVTDPAGKTNSFLYDTNHQIVATYNPLGLVASNIYNGFGRVTTQYTRGLANQTWHIYWSGWETVSLDPAGGQQNYFYDDQSRLTGQQDALGNVTQTAYDGQNHIVLTVSPLGEINQFVYDGNNNLIQQIDPLGYTNQFFYDSNNNLIQALDADNHPTTFGYNAQFSLIGRTNGANDWVNYTFNTDGTLAARVDSGSTNSYTYDGYGLLQSSSYFGLSGSDNFINNSLGDVTTHTDPRGFATTFNYNQSRQLISSVATNNLTNGITYDAVGNAATASDARGNTLTNFWSVTRHLLGTTLPATLQGAPAVTNVYDARDWLVQTLDPYQKTTTYSNDPADRLILVTDPVQHSASLVYDADGRQLSTANAANETNRQTWDARGLLLSQTDGAGHVILSSNDPAGNQVILTNRNGKTWQFYFDAANRLTGTVSPLGRSNSVAYNHQGLVSATTDQSNQPSYFYYDARGHLTSRTDNLATTTYGHDPNENLTSVTESGHSNVWTYDAYNRVSTYLDVSSNLVQYRYDANGNVTNLIYPGGHAVTNYYDALNRLTNVTDWAGRKTTLTYDLNSRLTSITRPNGTYRTISYDAAGETTNIWEQMANGLPIAWFRYNWANSGNLGWEFAAPLPHTNTPPLRTMTYDADNRLYSFQGPGMTSAQNVTMDLTGNLLTGPLTNNTFTNCNYDVRNRLLNAGGLTYTYDALNNRISQTAGATNTTYVVNPSSALPQVLLRIKNGVTNYYVYGAGLMYQVTETATGTNTLTYHYDYRGSTVALTGDNGVPTDRVEYSLYGSTTWRAGTNDTPFLFNGQYGVQSDPNGLLYMGARYYNPYLCRFINADPSGFSGGLNMYAYANGNPASYLDPFGLGALGESTLSSTWFDAPTAQQTAIQNGAADFLNMVTLGTANLASSAATGKDLQGNNLDFGDAFTTSLKAGVFVASLALSLPTDGASLEADAALTGGRGAAEETAGVVGEAAQTGGRAPNFIVSEGGTVYPVPEGATGPFPAESGKGFQFTGGSGGNGLSPSVTDFRFMDPVTTGKYQYPGGYGSYGNAAGQTVNPLTGQTIAPSNPWWHIPGQ